MCGIAGFLVGPSTPPRADLQERLARMARCMEHRGPDDEGLDFSPDGRVGLASRRLAIRDLSPAGHMPMSNQAGTVCIAYNGEIYNGGELRPELERLGYSFRSHSDTEVILHGYQAWGENVVQRLRGMWAFAIHDRRPQAGADGTVFLSRDRLGIKPLYYAVADGVFLFASELKALQASGLTSREINPSGLVGYLLMGSVPNPLTIYRGVHSLEPAHNLTLPLDQATSPQPARYWALPTDTVEPASYEAAVEQVRELLHEAVKIRLVSDVPLGAFLSGGLDSSAIVALMRQATGGTIRTCSITFEEAEYAEGSYARAVAEAFGTEHQERIITVHDLSSEMENILRAMDQPTVDGVNTYFVSQTAKQAGLTVALSGVGGDEIFGGYPNTFSGVPEMLRMLARAQSIPGGAASARLATQLLPRRQYWAKARDALARPASPASAYLSRRGVFSLEEARQLVSPEVWQEGIAGFDPVAHIAARANRNGQPLQDGEIFEWVSRAELSCYTHHQLLRDTDAMSMAHSLEVRVPLLDHKLVEAVLRLPAHVKRQGAPPKPLLKAAIGELLPDIVLNRRDKQGFTFPFDRWMEQLRRDVPESTDGLWQPKGVQAVWASHAAKKTHWSRPWTLAIAQRWGALNTN